MAKRARLQRRQQHDATGGYPPTTGSAPRPAPPRRGQAPSAPPPVAPDITLRPAVVVALTVLCWLLGALTRLAAVPEAQASDVYAIDGRMTLTATDGFAWAASVLNGLGRIDEPLVRLMVWTDQAHTLFATLLARVVHHEHVFVWMPALVAPLLVVPLMAIGVLLRRPVWGYAAGLLGAVGFSYYKRTRAAYFDTDMFSVTVPTVVSAALIATVVHRSARVAWVAALLVATGPFFYSSTGPVLFVASALFVAYVLALHRAEPFAMPAIAFVTLANLPLSVSARVVVLAAAGAGVLVWARAPALRAWVERVPPRTRQVIAGAAFGVVLLTALSTRLEGLWQATQGYLSRQTDAPAQADDIAFMPVFAAVREARNVPFQELAERFAGSTGALLVAAAAYVIACVRFRPLALTLPLAATGAFANWGGLRFTIYGVPVVALGLGWLAAGFATWLAARATRGRALLAVILTTLLLAPIVAFDVKDARDTKAEPKVLPSEAALMTKLGGVAKPGDYALSWWDYGYPLWYYAGINTFVDGSRSGHDALVPSLVMMTSDMRLAANLSRTVIEQYQSHPEQVAIDGLFAEARARSSTPRAYLDQLASPSFQPPMKTRDAYLYLPYRVLTIANTIENFSRAARSPSGDTDRRPLLVYSPAKKSGEDILFARGGQRFSPKDNTLIDERGGPVPLRAVHVVDTDETGKHRVRTRDLEADGGAHLIVLRDQSSLLLVDQAMFDSVLVQLLVLNRPNPSFFRPVARTAGGAVFRVEG